MKMKVIGLKNITMKNASERYKIPPVEKSIGRTSNMVLLILEISTLNQVSLFALKPDFPSPFSGARATFCN